jgi:hypothetical protein
MIGRRAVIGLSLLSALLFCALAASSASASVAVNTTSVTCVKGKGDFSDVHCNNKVASGTGEFSHVAIPVGEKTALEGHNKAGKEEGGTSAVLKAEPLKAKVEITCANLGTEGGAQTNEEPSAKVHNTSGSATVNLTKCVVNAPAKCTVKEPISTKVEYRGVEGLGTGKNEMGLEYKPLAGKPFVTITLEGAECSIKGTPFNVEGTAIGTGVPAPTEKHAGAEIKLTNAMTKETLTAGGRPAEFSVTSTVQVAGGGTPIALTTTT